MGTYPSPHTPESCCLLFDNTPWWSYRVPWGDKRPALNMARSWSASFQGYPHANLLVYHRPYPSWCSRWRDNRLGSIPFLLIVLLVTFPSGSSHCQAHWRCKLQESIAWPRRWRSSLFHCSICPHTSTRESFPRHLACRPVGGCLNCRPRWKSLERILSASMV